MKVLCEGVREQLYAKFMRNSTIIVIHRGLFTNTQDVQNQTLQKQTFVCAKHLIVRDDSYRANNRRCRAKVPYRDIALLYDIADRRCREPSGGLAPRAFKLRVLKRHRSPCSELGGCSQPSGRGGNEDAAGDEGPPGVATSGSRRAVRRKAAAEEK